MEMWTWLGVELLSLHHLLTLGCLLMMSKSHWIYRIPRCLTLKQRLQTRPTSRPESSQVGRRLCSRGARGLEEEEEKQQEENGGGEGGVVLRPPRARHERGERGLRAAARRRAGCDGVPPVVARGDTRVVAVCGHAWPWGRRGPAVPTGVAVRLYPPRCCRAVLSGSVQHTACPPCRGRALRCKLQSRRGSQAELCLMRPRLRPAPPLHPFLRFWCAGTAGGGFALEQRIRTRIRVALGLCLLVDLLQPCGREEARRDPPVRGTCSFPCQKGLGARQGLAARVGVHKPTELPGAEHPARFGARWGRCKRTGWR
nr:uncharacterized protein LOC106043663 [Anser cygnoides]